MTRPTLSLAMIVKNEEKNLKKLFESIEGCFDEIHITDTGSTDGTVALAQSLGATVHHFRWVDDFAKARNYSFSKCNTDYVMWMDGDDVLSDKDMFIKWRDNVMNLSNFWLATYNYAYKDDKPIVSFVRERVVSKSVKADWKYFIHEGYVPEPGQDLKMQHAHGWTINHKRTVADLEADRGRNIDIIEKHILCDGDIPNRLKFYYGKELADTGRYNDSVEVFNELDFKSLESHDRILGLQYFVKSLTEKGRFDKKLTKEAREKLFSRAFATCLQAITLAPNRAELYILAGDCLVQKNDMQGALPFYHAAKGITGDGGPSALFNFDCARQEIPREQIARIYAHLNKLDLAINEAQESFDLYGSETSKKMLDELSRVKDVTEGDFLKSLPEVNDVVISCPPGTSVYTWDDEVYKTSGIGGSETAAVEIAEHIAKNTDHRVIVFNDRESMRVSDNGVEYRSNQEMKEYFLSVKPHAHIAWRHNLKMTAAPTYLWCHDLITRGAEAHHVYDKILCLTEFHKNYVQIQQSIPDDKILITRNGINQSRFKNVDSYKKNKYAVVFPSSPDRGLDRAINIVDKARELSGLPIELNVFYGFQNLRKHGMNKMADDLEGMISKRPWIKFHGNVDQKTLAKHFMESSVWLYPANFIETFCITAIEALSAKCFPLVRYIGALKDTLKEADQKGMAKFIYKDAFNKEDVELWARELIAVIEEEKWKNIDVSDKDYSWSSVGDEFIEFLNLETKKCPVVVNNIVDRGLSATI